MEIRGDEMQGNDLKVANG